MATWKVWCEILDGTDATTGKRVYQPIKFNKDIVLKGVRLYVAAYNDPTFSNLSFEIYSLQNGVVGKLLHASTSTVSKAQILTTDTNALKEIYFDFSNLPTFKGSDTYAGILRVSGYTYSPTSFVALRKAFPDPVYTENVTIAGMQDVHKSPYYIYFIGAKL